MPIVSGEPGCTRPCVRMRAPNGAFTYKKIAETPVIARYIARQFRQPTGFLGRVIGRGMARHNEREARWTIGRLAIQPDARVLEIGFGPGVAIQYAAERATRGYVSGIDYSEAMLKIARKRNASAIARVRRRSRPFSCGNRAEHPTPYFLPDGDNVVLESRPSEGSRMSPRHSASWTHCRGACRLCARDATLAAHLPRRFPCSASATALPGVLW